MDIPQQKYRKVLNEYRSNFNNILNQYPINWNRAVRGGKNRNLDYIINKEIITGNYPYYHPIYQQTLQDMKTSLSDPSMEVRALTIRLARTLPFLFRIKFIQSCQNQITNAVLSTQKQDKDTGFNSYGYETSADFSQFLLSVFELTSQSEEIYFDVNQRIITIFSRYFESALSADKNSLRNAFEVLRNIFLCFGPLAQRQDTIENKLIAKIIGNLMPQSSFVNKVEASMISALGNRQLSVNNTKLMNLILRTRQFQVRLRGRLLYGFCCLLSYLPQMDYQLLGILQKQIGVVLDNISECDVYLQCFGCLSALTSQQQNYSTRNILFKKWYLVLSQISYKKEYLQYYICLLQLVNQAQYQVPHRLRYSLSMFCLQLARNVQQQYTRFLIYNGCCRNIVGVSRMAYKSKKEGNFLLKIFHYNWFIDSINQENDLFKSEFLICLLQSFADSPESPSHQEITDLIDICHRLIDWKCISKEQTHIPTLKFAFDMYLNFLKQAQKVLQNRIQPHIVQLINRCNQPSIYFLFKFKLIATLLELDWYQLNFKYLHNAKLNFQFVQYQIKAVMMPKNPKPIFLYQYSLSYDGQIQSRKEIQYIKIIMHLLEKIQKVHQQFQEYINGINDEYRLYLRQLQTREDSNKELINCLQSLQADYYFNECQRYFLLTALPAPLTHKAISFQTNMEDAIIYSPWESIYTEEEINIFGPMSPVQLTITLRPHPSFSAVFIHIRKNQWVQTQGELNLIVSSGIEKRQLPFESSILEMKIDRIGSLHFQVWKGTQSDMLLGSGSFRIKRRLHWRRVDHLSSIDGLHMKIYFKQVEQKSPQKQSYLSYYYGQPLLIHIIKSSNQVVVGVSNKEMWNQLREFIPEMVQELTTGSAVIIDSY